MELVRKQGTGSKGTSSSPISITFSFAPKIVFFIGKTMYYSSGNATYNNVQIRTEYHSSYNEAAGCNAEFISTSYSAAARCMLTTANDSTDVANNNVYIKKSSDGKTIYWYAAYSTADADYIGNGSSSYYTAYYYWLGLG